MKCKHGVERPSYERYLELEKEYKEIHSFTEYGALFSDSIRRAAEKRCAELKRKMHPCYTCFTEN